MLSNFRRVISGWVSKVAIGVIVLALIFVGGQSFLQTPSSETDVVIVMVNGEELKLYELQQEFNNQAEIYRDVLENNPNNDEINSFLQQTAMRNLVNSSLMWQKIANQGIYISDDIILKNISNQEVFQNDDGSFAADKFSSFLVQSGMTEELFYELAMKRNRSVLLSNALVNDNFISGPSRSLWFSLVEQKRSFSLLPISAEVLTSSIAIDEDEMLTRYEESRQRYTESERLSFQYISLSPSDIEITTPAPIEEIDLLYENELNRINSNNEVEVAHIFLDKAGHSQSELDGLSATISESLSEDENSFESLVVEYSEDIVSRDVQGSLGEISLSSLPQELQTAIESMQEGEVRTDPVETDYGYHFLRLISKVQNEQIDEAQIREVAIENWRANEQNRIFNERLEEIDNSLYVDNMENVAQRYSLEIKTTDYIQQGSHFYNLFEGITEQEEIDIRNAIYDPEILDEGRNTRLIQLSNGESISISLNDTIEERQMTFDEVRDEIYQSILLEKLGQKSQDILNNALASIQNGENIDDVVRNISSDVNNALLEWQSYSLINRYSTDIPRGVLDQVFSMKLSVNEEDRYVIDTSLADNNVYLIRLEDIENASYSSSDVAIQNIFEENLNDQIGIEALDLYIIDETDRSDIVYPYGSEI